MAVVGIAVMGQQHLFEEWTIEEWMLSLMIAIVGILGSMLMTKVTIKVWL